jgi:hypothetical protein
MPLASWGKRFACAGSAVPQTEQIEGVEYPPTL